MGNFKLPKEERLHGTRAVKSLLNTGASFFLSPIRVRVSLNPHPCKGHQVMFLVPKRFHPLATNRNRLKRLMREAYRLHKSRLHELPSLCIAYIYSSREQHDYHHISERIQESFNYLKSYAQKN